MNTMEKGKRISELMQEIDKCTLELEQLLGTQQPVVENIKIIHTVKPKNVRRPYMTKARKRSLLMKKNWAKLSPYKRRKWVAQLRISVQKALAAKKAKMLASQP